MFKTCNMPKSTGGDNAYTFGALLMTFQLVVIILFATVVDYQNARGAVTEEDEDRVNWYYPMYQDVHVMIFIGFGFLMTFLAKYSWSSISYNMLVSCLCIQWTILVHGFWHSIIAEHWEMIQMSMESLVIGDFAAGAVLISFGGLLGRITPTQLLVMAIIEILFYVLNEQIGVVKSQAVDMGGSMYVHSFGAYFGLAVSAVMGAPKGDSKKAEKLNSAVYQSDLLAMVGTIFLFMFWPSFNGVLCPNDNFAKERVVLNTVMALCCSCMTSFAFSRIFDPSHKFNMAHIQNATLAGGVAVGSSSDLVIGPWAAMLMGVIAGAVSTLGYIYVSPFLERKGLRDTCGINNLHGMPGVIGGIGGIFSAGFAGDSAYGSNISEIFAARGEGRSAWDQAGYQACALLTTLGISISSGYIVGKLLTSRLFNQEQNAFSDESHWLLESDEEEKDVELGQTQDAVLTMERIDNAEDDKLLPPEKPSIL